MRKRAGQDPGKTEKKQNLARVFATFCIDRNYSASEYQWLDPAGT